MTNAPSDEAPLSASTSGVVAGPIAQRDWSATPLGPLERWPQPLRLIVDLMLSSKPPMFVVWGPQRTFLYNDAYVPIAAEKHPAAFGEPFDEVWREIWPELAPLFARTMAGEPIYHEDQRFVLNRRGFDEEAWFTFSYSPVREDSGAIGGVFCVLNETTQVFQAERALRESEARLRFAIDGARIGTRDWDLTTMRGYAAVNRSG